MNVLKEYRSFYDELQSADIQREKLEEFLPKWKEASSKIYKKYLEIPRNHATFNIILKPKECGTFELSNITIDPYRDRVGSTSASKFINMTISEFLSSTGDKSDYFSSPHWTYFLGVSQPNRERRRIELIGVNKQQEVINLIFMECFNFLEAIQAKKDELDRMNHRCVIL